MNNSSASTASLQQDKETIKQGLREGTANGVVGVGIDSINQVLLVFVREKAEANKFLAKAGVTAPSRLYSKDIGVFGRFGNFLRRVSRAFSTASAHPCAAISLKPTSVIEPDRGDTGSLGCFVSLGDGTIAALTAEHLFHNRGEQTVSRRECYSVATAIRALS